MSKELFRVVSSGKLISGRNKASVIEELANLFGIDQERAAILLNGQDKTVKKNLSQHNAVKFQSIVEKAGLACRVEQQENVSQAAKTQNDSGFVCPKCGYASSPACKIPDNGSCPKCGIIIQNYLKRLSEAAAPKPSSSEKPFIDSDTADGSEPPSNPIIKVIKWAGITIGVIIFLWTGISVFDTPTYEIIYRLNDPRRICQDDPQIKHHPELMGSIAETGWMDACIRSFRLDIFNAGMKIQPQTVVRLRLTEEYQDMIIDEPIFLNFDRNRREVKARRNGDIMSYALGPLESADHVTLRIKALVVDEMDINWNSLLESIDVAKGEIVQGESPKITFIARLIFSLINWGAKDNLEKLADIFLDGVSDTDMAINEEFDQDSADLAVSIQSDGVPRHVADSGQPYRYSVNIKVENLGPVSADKVELTYNIPDTVTIIHHGFEIKGVIPTVAELIKESKPSKNVPVPSGCELNQDGTFTCFIERLLPESSAFVFLTVSSEGKEISYYTAAVSHEKDDPDDSNNTIVMALGAE